MFQELLNSTFILEKRFYLLVANALAAIYKTGDDFSSWQPLIKPPKTPPHYGDKGALV